MTSDDETKALKPTSKEINAVIADMVGVGPLTPGDPDVPLCVPLWYVTAYDPQGKKRGTGADTTLACAAAAAWVLSHDGPCSVEPARFQPCATSRARRLDFRD
jgi:hypothetical protein